MVSYIVMSTELIVDILLILCFLVDIVLFVQFSLVKSRYHMSSGSNIELDDLPTVSLCIPARNETYALADCLTSAIASDYPKLEIIVLDDCSQDQTSQVIRSFAHDGVRFVSGDTPSDGWLGKNNAYKALAAQAKGEYLVFMSVDTRVSVNSISRLVGYMQQEKVSMASVLPQRLDSFKISVIFASLRYFWQVVTPLKFNTPLATSLWSIRMDALEKAGGFELYKDMVDVENQLANQLSADDNYRFLIANDALQVSYAKHWRSQAATSIRLWYPTLKKSYTVALLAIIGHFTLFVLPWIVLLSALATNSDGRLPTSLILAVGVCFLTSYIYILYFYSVKKITRPLDYYVVALGFVVLPILAIQEILLIIVSFIQYKRGKVDWKGRNICYPITKRY